MRLFGATGFGLGDWLRNFPAFTSSDLRALKPVTRLRQHVPDVAAECNVGPQNLVYEVRLGFRVCVGCLFGDIEAFLGFLQEAAH